MTSPVDFINQYHKDTVAQKKALQNPDGSITTVNSMGIPLNGKIYLVPGYNRDTGKKLTEEEAYSLWKNKIPKLEKKGLIVGIEDNWAGERQDHPANVISRENHKFLDDEIIPPEAIGFGLRN
jgi:hypothetical protein